MKKLLDEAVANGVLAVDATGHHSYQGNITIKLWGEGEQIDLTNKNIMCSLIPTEFHIKADGDINNEPSLAIVMEDCIGAGVSVVGQISYKMLLPVIEALEKAKGTKLN